MAPRRLLSISHSYVVDLNRRLAHEMARAGRGRWEVTAVAPPYFDTYLRPVAYEGREEEPCRIEKIPMRLSSWVHWMFYGGALKDVLRRPWDLVHCWEEPYIVAGAQIAFWTPERVPLVYQSYQNISKRYPPPFSWIERYCLERCAGWIGAGELVVETLLGRGYGVKPHRHIPDGVDLEAFRPDPKAKEETRRRLGLDGSGPPVIGYLARFVEEKGLRILTAALERVGASWRALFVGEGTLEGELRKWAQGRRQARVVTGVRHAQVPAYLNAMDFLCVPSQTTPRWREQFGRMTIEAMACGIPVIGSDSGEVPRVVADAGLVVGEKDVAGWARRVEELLESPSLRAELGLRGLERARRLYAWPVVAKSHLDFFEELL